ncbi:hypothetical protein CMI42_02805 [Candidatus Pacearchaeota archaeon]|nr:hypothetical protein [Candidatus Pacearchaeota archaeon]
MEKKKIHKFKTKILGIKNLCEDTKHFIISTPDDFDFHPGQFISLIMDKDGGKIKRPYSIASKPAPLSLELCIKIIPDGNITPLLDKLREGNEIDALGPLGHFTIKDISKDLIFISTGTGITPFRSMIHHLLNNNHKNNVRLITGYRYEKGILYESELNGLSNKHSNFSYHRVLSRPDNEKDQKGYVQDVLKKDISKDAHYYICGLKEMVNSVKDLLLKEGIPKENIFFEKYD